LVLEAARSIALFNTCAVAYATRWIFSPNQD
jgi:hypothetical protein